VLRQRLSAQGCTGGITLVRPYLTRVRPASAQTRAFIRFESAPGVQCQIDWGHFGSLAYGSTTRKLYCLAVVECHSQLLSLECTQAPQQDPLHCCRLNAFHFFQGPPQELVHANLLTAVLERQGPLVRFNDHFFGVFAALSDHPHRLQRGPTPGKGEGGEGRPPLSPA
jgi:transposase